MSITLETILEAAEQHQASDVFLQEGEIPSIKINEQIGVLQYLLPQSNKQGMHTIDDCLMELLMDDRIHLNHALAHARDPKALKTQFQEELQNRSGSRGRLVGT